MKPRIAIYLCDEEGERFFGLGPWQLLKEVQERGSLLAAAQEMKMAYTKALTLIKRAEKGLGFALMEKKIGGAGGGGSALTPEARELLRRYAAYREACVESSQQLYHTWFDAPLTSATDTKTATPAGVTRPEAADRK